ncbi:MAG: cytochrome c biogenesis protein ResB [Clostridia bacterium]|nr:cytochrome c biogenesis protein ResB [Clostridia bacterium]
MSYIAISIWRFLTSVKLAMALLILIILLILMAVLTEVDKLPLGVALRNLPIIKTLGLDSPLDTWFFMATVYLLLINTFCCTWAQVKKARLLWWRPPGRLTPKFSWDISKNGEKPYNRITALLRARGYKIVIEKGILTAQRNRWGCVGPIILHVGLIVIMVGGLLKLNAGMTGIFPVTEGFAFEDRPENYITYQKGPWFDHSSSLFTLTLDKFYYRINAKKYPDKFEAALRVAQSNGETGAGAVSTGFPLTMGHLTFHSYDNFGFTPRLIIQEEGGGVLDSYIALDTSWNGSAREFIFRGEFTQPSSGKQVEVEFYPDGDEIRPKPVKKSYRFDSPAVSVVIKNGSGGDFRQVIQKGEEKKQGNIRVAFQDYRAWASLVVKVDPGMNLVYAGFWLVIGGTALIYLVIPRRIEVWAGDDGILNLGATTPRFFGSFNEELEEIKVLLRE